MVLNANRALKEMQPLPENDALALGHSSPLQATVCGAFERVVLIHLYAVVLFSYKLRQQVCIV